MLNKRLLCFFAKQDIFYFCVFCLETGYVSITHFLVLDSFTQTLRITQILCTYLQKKLAAKAKDDLSQDEMSQDEMSSGRNVHQDKTSASPPPPLAVENVCQPQWANLSVLRFEVLLLSKRIFEGFELVLQVRKKVLIMFYLKFKKVNMFQQFAKNSFQMQSCSSSPNGLLFLQHFAFPYLKEEKFFKFFK